MSIKVFYCYAREDKLLRTKLEKHLGNLKLQGLITGWSDRDIDAGNEWAKEIDSNLKTANIILLLISPDFMHSKYCYGVEMTQALERQKYGTARVIPIILRPVDYEGAPFSHLQALPTDATPITDRKWRSLDEALLDVAQGIRKIVKELLSKQWQDEGDIQYYRQQYEDALVAYKQAIYFDPQNVLAYVGQGQALNELAHREYEFGIDKYQEAVTALKHAINLDPANACAHIGKGIALLGISTYTFEAEPNEKEEILAAFDEALRLDPNNEAAYIGRGNTFMLFHNRKEAITAYEKALEVSGYPHREVYKKLAEALFQLKRYEEALSTYEICIKEYIDDPDLYVSIGNILFDLKRDTEALSAYEKALSHGYKSGEIYTLKGNALHRLNRWQDALAAFDEALRLLPKHLKITRANAHRGKKAVFESLAQREGEKADELNPPEDEFP